MIGNSELPATGNHLAIGYFTGTRTTVTLSCGKVMGSGTEVGRTNRAWDWHNVVGFHFIVHLIAAGGANLLNLGRGGRMQLAEVKIRRHILIQAAVYAE